MAAGERHLWRDTDVEIWDKLPPVGSRACAYKDKCPNVVCVAAPAGSSFLTGIPSTFDCLRTAASVPLGKFFKKCLAID